MVYNNTEDAQADMDFFSVPPCDHPKGWPWIGQHIKCWKESWHVIRPSWARKESRPEARAAVGNNGFVPNHEVTSIFHEQYERICTEWAFTNYYYDHSNKYYEHRPSQEFLESEGHAAWTSW